MTPFNMPLPSAGPNVLTQKPPVPTKPPVSASSAASLDKSPTFEKSLDRAIAEESKVSQTKNDPVKTEQTSVKQTETPEAENVSGESNPGATESVDEQNSSVTNAKSEAAAQQKALDSTDAGEVSTEAELLPDIEGVGLFDTQRQLFDKLLKARQERPLPTPLEKDEFALLPPEALLIQLAALATGAGILPGGQEQSVNPEGMTPPPPATPVLPSSGLAFLTEMLSHTQTTEKTEPTVQPSVLSTGNASESYALGLRVISHSKGGQAAAPPSGPPVSSQSPNFADELMDRVGRMRIFSRGGGESEQQVRITLVPEDLGTVDLRLRVDAHNRVHLMITTETDAARELMSRQLNQLRDALERQSMSFGDVTVDIEDQRAGGKAWAEWRFGEQFGQTGNNHDQERTVREILPEAGGEAAISASENGLSIFV